MQAHEGCVVAEQSKSFPTCVLRFCLFLIHLRTVSVTEQRITGLWTFLPAVFFIIAALHSRWYFIVAEGVVLTLLISAMVCISYSYSFFRITEQPQYE
jgi:hypothetical protein